jgi:hypothetical protein
MGLFSRFASNIDLKRLLKDAPITYKLNDKGDAIQLFGQSFYRTDPSEIILNPEHTSIILYGHNGKNIYGIYGEGLLETDTWKEWTDKQFDNKDINSIHVSPFYKARIILRIPKNTSIDLSGFNYEEIDDHTIAINYNGSNRNVLHIPYGATVMSIEAIQSSKKEYFGPIIIEPSATTCATSIIDKILKTVIIITVALVFIALLYKWMCRKEFVIVEHPFERTPQTMQVLV